MKKIFLISTLLILTSQTSCVPVAIVGGAGALGYTATQDRSVGQTIDDATIEAKINAKFVSQPNRDIFQHVNEDSVEGRVLLTGSVPTQEAKIQTYNLVSQVNGVKGVINQLKVEANKQFSARQYASDSWISTQLESRMLFTKDIKSSNYSVETIEGVVYLMGIAQDKSELDAVTQMASQVPGVQKVVSYVRIKGQAVNNVNRNTIPVEQEQIQTVPGSVGAGSGQQAPTTYNSGDLIIEESPNAQ